MNDALCEKCKTTHLTVRPRVLLCPEGCCGGEIFLCDACAATADWQDV